ncbi:MAG: hypothetical protein HY735_22055 [Verrucomicrobia bacterium]|nr:hypothetical protein [Verrucomicrobiota bacterium]
MSLPDFILHNFRWKAGALALAVFIWFLIQVAISKGFRPSDHPLTESRDDTFPDLPVLVLTAPGDKETFTITPARVDVTIRSTPSALSRLEKTDIRAFVDLADATNGTKETREVLVSLPTGFEAARIKVKPSSVTAERVINSSNE